MWILASRGRPKLAAEAVEACTRAGMTRPAVLYVDGADPCYDRIRLPSNWLLHVEREPRGLSQALRWCLAAFPHERSYGWLADDMRPLSDGWDVELEAAAGTDQLAQADDRWASLQAGNDPGSVSPTAGICTGAGLIEAVGWWALPGSYQAGTDVAWQLLAHRTGRVRYLGRVVVEHRHWRTGKRPQDSLDTDRADANGHAHTKRDLELFYRWRDSTEPATAAARIRERFDDPLNEQQANPELYAELLARGLREPPEGASMAPVASKA